MYRSLEITTKIGCKNRCTYCPQDLLIKKYSKLSDINNMSLKTFQKCIDKIPKDVNIHFSGFTEPFLNERCAEMILYANKKGHKIRIYTTTLGITKKDIDKIKNICFDRFIIHVPSKKKRMNIRINKEYLNNIKYILKNKISNISYTCPGIDKPDYIHPELKKLFDQYKILEKNWILNSRAQNIQINGLKIQKDKKSDITKCIRLKRNILLPNGDVALCCSDWGLKHIIGNLLKSDYNSLFKSQEYSKIIDCLNKKSGNVLCMNCDALEK